MTRRGRFVGASEMTTKLPAGAICSRSLLGRIGRDILLRLSAITVLAVTIIGLTLVTFGAAIPVGTSNGGGSKLAPVGATQPSATAKLPTCDPEVPGPPAPQEGACRSG